MEDQVIFSGKTKDDREYIVRYPNRNDAQLMTDYINVLSKERTYIRFQGEEMKLADEQKFLEDQLQRIEEGLSVMLFIVCDGRIAGISSVDMKDKIESHVAGFGISLLQELRGAGIGRIFMDLILKEAEKKLKMLRIITLSVLEGNTRAQSLYNKFGFQIYGSLPGGVFYKESFIDHIFMYKKIGIYE